VLADAFDPDPEAAAPAGWTVTGPAVVTADPGGLTGRSLSLTGPATAQHSFSATGGSVRADLRLLAAQRDKDVSVTIVDTHDHPVLSVGLGASGNVTYTDAGSVKETSFRYLAGDWTAVSVLLRPSAGSYTLTADGLPVATGKLTAGSGIPDRIKLHATGGRFAVDDVIVSPACCPC